MILLINKWLKRWSSSHDSNWNKRILIHLWLTWPTFTYQYIPVLELHLIECFLKQNVYNEVSSFFFYHFVFFIAFIVVWDQGTQWLTKYIMKNRVHVDFLDITNTYMYPWIFFNKSADFDAHNYRWNPNMSLNESKLFPKHAMVLLQYKTW